MKQFLKFYKMIWFFLAQINGPTLHKKGKKKKTKKRGEYVQWEGCMYVVIVRLWMENVEWINIKNNIVMN